MAKSTLPPSNNKTRKPPIPATQKKAAKRPAATKKGKKKTSQKNSSFRIFLAVIAIVFISAISFYFFYIRPYAYRWKPCYGFKEYGVCMPFGYQIHGMDISRYQGGIDWDVLKMGQATRYPLHFAFIKATEGGDLHDRTFSYNFESARKHGFIRGAYHFYIPSTCPLKQADFFINTVKLQKGDLPPVLDIEVTGKKQAVELRRDLKKWLDRVEQHYKVKPIIYASFKFKNTYLNDSTFNSYPYWIAHYYVDSVAYEGQWKFWQHTDRGIVPGIPEMVDLNVFNGSLEELSKLTIQ